MQSWCQYGLGFDRGLGVGTVLVSIPALVLIQSWCCGCSWFQYGLGFDTVLVSTLALVLVWSWCCGHSWFQHQPWCCGCSWCCGHSWCRHWPLCVDAGLGVHTAFVLQPLSVLIWSLCCGRSWCQYGLGVAAALDFDTGLRVDTVLVLWSFLVYFPQSAIQWSLVFSPVVLLVSVLLFVCTLVVDLTWFLVSKPTVVGVTLLLAFLPLFLLVWTRLLVSIPRSLLVERSLF